MRKNIQNYLLGALLVMATSACSNEELMQPEATPDATGEVVTVKAYVPGNGAPMSRVALTAGGTEDAPTVSVAWKDGDKFTVIRNGNYLDFTKAAGTNDFTGTLPDAGGSGLYYALYPAETGLTGAYSYVDLRSQGSGSLNPNLTYMYATSEDGQTFEFRHLTALLKPTFTGIPAGETVTSVAIVCDAPTEKSQDLTNNTVNNSWSKSISFTTLSAYIYLPPMTTGQKLEFTVSTNQNTYAATLTAQKDIVAGKLYTTTIALDASVSTEWKPGTSAVQPVGEGTENSPYLIANAPNLQWLKDNNYQSSGKYYRLTADLTINGAWEPIAPTGSSSFQGTFDGNDHSISGTISYNNAIYNYQPCGLFGYNEGTIRNLNMDVTVNDDRSVGSEGDTRYIGTVAAYNNENGVIENCTNEGTVTGTIVSAMATAYVGGIVGYNKGTITRCTNKEAVTGVPQSKTSASYSYAGGIVGYHVSGLVSECINEGAIRGSEVYEDAGNSVVGGIAGQIGSAVIIGCTNSGAVTGVQSSGSWNYAGGIVGSDFSSSDSYVIAGCINSGAVTGGLTSSSTQTSRTGGVIGRSRGSATTTFCIACANTGTLTAGTGAGNTYVAAIGVGEFTRTTLWAAGDSYKADTDGSYTLMMSTSAEQTSKDAISAMNAAIATYNATAADGKKCPYIWQWESGDWPTLVENE